MKRFLVVMALLGAAFAGDSPSLQLGTVSVNGTTCATAGACVAYLLSDRPSVAVVTISGTYTATLQFEGSADGGGTVVAVTGTPIPSAAGVTSTTSTGTWVFNVAGLTNFQVRASAYTSGSPTITINSGKSGIAIEGTGKSVNVAQVGGTAVVANPCQAIATTPKSVSGTASAVLITGTAAKKTYICSVSVVAAAAQNIAFVEGTGSTCGTNTITVHGLSGGTTAATGWNFAANGGIAQGSGLGSLANTSVNADDLCILVANAVQTNVSVTYVQQ